MRILLYQKNNYDVQDFLYASVLRYRYITCPYRECEKYFVQKSAQVYSLFPTR